LGKFICKSNSIRKSLRNYFTTRNCLFLELEGQEELSLRGTRARSFKNQARKIRAIAGMERKRALTIHHFALGFPLPFCFTAITATANPPRRPTKAIRRAMSPRVKQPRTSTGVKATRKKKAGRIAGARTCRMKGFLPLRRPSNCPANYSWIYSLIG
jgi:hypothetical protein